MTFKIYTAKGRTKLSPNFSRAVMLVMSFTTLLAQFQCWNLKKYKTFFVPWVMANKIKSMALVIVNYKSVALFCDDKIIRKVIFLKQHI